MASRTAKRSDRTCRPGGRAFTLVELLVVVSIIALLIAILLPSLRKARTQTKALVCKANLRSMGQAFTMYAESHKGVLPPVVDTMATQNRWPVPFHLGGIIKAQLARFDASGNPTKTAETSIFICPEEKAPRVLSWDAPNTHPVDRVEVGGSYALTEESQRINGELKRVPPVSRTLESCRRSSEVYVVMENYRPLEKAASVGWCFNRGVAEQPAGTYIMSPPLDSRAFYFTYRNMDGTPFTFTPTYERFRVVGGHHAGAGNALCIDTHAESYKPDKVAYNQVSWTRWPRADKPPGGL